MQLPVYSNDVLGRRPRHGSRIEVYDAFCWRKLAELADGEGGQQAGLAGGGCGGLDVHAFIVCQTSGRNIAVLPSVETATKEYIILNGGKIPSMTTVESPFHVAFAPQLRNPIHVHKWTVIIENYFFPEFPYDCDEKIIAVCACGRKLTKEEIEAILDGAG